MVAKDLILFKLQELIDHLREVKGDDRSELARRYAIIITDLEKVYAYYNTFVNGQ